MMTFLSKGQSQSVMILGWYLPSSKRYDDDVMMMIRNQDKNIFHCLRFIPDFNFKASSSDLFLELP